MTAWLPYLLGLAAVASTYADGLLALRFCRRRRLLFALTGGMAVGLALLDLLPEALGSEGADLLFNTVAAGVSCYLFSIWCQPPARRGGAAPSCTT